MKPARPKRCVCGAVVVQARDDGYHLVELDAQGMSRAIALDPLVLWWEEGAATRVQRVTPLADFERAHGPWTGPVWVLHWSVCPELDRPLGLRLSARGRKLLAILTGPEKRKGGGA